MIITEQVKYSRRIVFIILCVSLVSDNANDLEHRIIWKGQ
jgi:hypothetical protein